ncbi:MAG: sigma 54-interacting transcriptional regulator [Planctomycetota bacterium]
MSKLRLFVKTPQGERVYDLDRDEVVVGRDPAVDVSFDDRRASRRHCRLVRHPDGWHLEDLQSSNGTTLNGTPVSEGRLTEGDRVGVGQAVLTVSFPEVREEMLTVARPVGAPVPPSRTPRDELADLRREVRALNHLVALNRRIAEAEEEGALLDAILDAAIELLGASRGLLLLSAEDHVTVRRARRPGGLPLEDPAASVSVTVAQTAIRDRHSIVTADAVADARFERAASIVGMNLRSVVCVPLLAGEAALGAVYLDDADRAGAFDARDVALLEAFAAQAALALQHCRQRKEAADRRREAVRQARRAERLNERLRKVLKKRTTALRQAREDLVKQADELSLKYRYDQIVGRSAAMRDVLRLVDRVTDLSLPVLVVGESGTGKELIARAIHFNGPRRRGRIVGENCGAVPETLMESEFFGYVRGAFTGAVRDHAGLFEQADKGTLFLDEVGETSLEMQKKLLRVLEEGEVRRVGGKASVPVDVRIVSATNRDLSEMLKDGRFREDLYYRLAGVVITLPPLRDRKDDIEPLVAHFLAEGGGTPPALEPAALELLLAYDWPGNVRELRNEIRRVAALHGGGSIRPEHLSPRITAYRPPDPERLAGRQLRTLVEDLERRVLRASLQRHAWNKSRAAEELGLSRLGLRKKLERYGLDEEQPGGRGAAADVVEGADGAEGPDPVEMGDDEDPVTE